MPHRRYLLLLPAGCLRFIDQGLLTAPWKPPPRVSEKRKTPVKRKERVFGQNSASWRLPVVPDTRRCRSRRVQKGLGDLVPPLRSRSRRSDLSERFLKRNRHMGRWPEDFGHAGPHDSRTRRLNQSPRAVSIKNRISNDATAPQWPRRRASLFFLTRAQTSIRGKGMNFSVKRPTVARRRR